MTNSKWLLVGLTMGFLASAVSCGEPKTCDSQSCPTGCCNADNECVTNTNAQACGSLGRECVACGFAQVCTQGLCTGNNGGSGGTTGGGAGSTGGGSGSTGGGTASNPTCTQLGTAETTLFAGNSVCSYDFDGGSASISASDSAVAGCNVVMSNAACTTADRSKMTTYVSCLQAAPACTSGNEQSAVTSALACGQSLYTGLSQACLNAISSPQGGGTGNTGGGSGTTGGGSATTGGGSATTGGGSATTGGGSATTGGGTGSDCSSAAASQATFFAGRSSCPSSSGTLNPIANLQNICTNSCTTTDQAALSAMGSCTASVPCTTGNENAAYSQYSACASDFFGSLSSPCLNAIIAGSSTGGGTGTTGGGTGTTGGGTGTTGGGTGSCTTISLGSFSQGSSDGTLTTYPAEPLGTVLGSSTLSDFAQLRFTSTSTGTFTFSASGLNIANCARCLLVGQDADASTGNPAKLYAASSGSISISGNSPVTGPLSATVSNVTLIEGTLDSSGNFTATSGGACLSVPSGTISAAAPIPGWVCPPTWYGDTECDCGCGVKDSDCASTNTVAQCVWCTNCGQGAQNMCTGYVNTTNTTQCL